MPFSGNHACWRCRCRPSAVMDVSASMPTRGYSPSRSPAGRGIQTAGPLTSPAASTSQPAHSRLILWVSHDTNLTNARCRARAALRTCRASPAAHAQHAYHHRCGHFSRMLRCLRARMRYLLHYPTATLPAPCYTYTHRACYSTTYTPCRMPSEQIISRFPRHADVAQRHPRLRRGKRLHSLAVGLAAAGRRTTQET